VTFLDILVQIWAFLIVAVPIGILVVGVVLYFLFPYKRMVTGIILAVLGSFGLFIFSMVLYNEIIEFNVKIIMILLVAIELITLILGIIFLIRNKNQLKT
jgi:hypothetical protein